MSLAETPPEPEDLHGLLIRSPARIEILLRRLRLQRGLLSVRAEPSARWHASMVLAVDAAAHRLDLDALNPVPAQPPQAGALVSVRGRIDGSDLRFRCRAVGGVMVDGGPALRTTLPEEIFVLERRAAYRRTLPEHLGLPPSAIGREQPEHDARLLDISHGGAGAVVPSEIGPAIGEALRMRIQLPGATLETQAEVRSTGAHPTGVRVGVQFDTLRGEDEKRLALAINTLERQMIRAARARR